MRIPLNEIWNFTDILDQGEERSLAFTLVAGTARIAEIDKPTIEALRSDSDYDTELLPSIFTFREILWQPDVYTEASMCLPSLRVLSSQCNEDAEKYRATKIGHKLIYAQLLEQVALASDRTIAALEKKKVIASPALGQFRTMTFPIVKFFISHPKNRKDYHQDAINRLNYAVKIMITDLHGKYTDLQDPYWEVVLANNVKNNASTLNKQAKTESPIEKD